MFQMLEMTLLDAVMNMIDAGRTDDEIVAAFADRFAKPGMLSPTLNGDPRPVLAMLRQAMRAVDAN